MSTQLPRVGFVMEQALGHVTYSRNLGRAYEGSCRLSPIWMPVPFDTGGLLDKLPGTRHSWAVRGSLRGLAALRSLRHQPALDAVLFHTQTVSLLAPLVVRRSATVISLDATPVNYDDVGVYYGHRAQKDSRVEQLKRGIYSRVFNHADALTSWSQWAKNSLRDDYGVDPNRVTVIAPGVDLELFAGVTEARCAAPQRRVQILFVGADFERKGGLLLLEYMRSVLASTCELHVVTRYPVPPTAGVHVYNDLGPNDPRLLALYKQADMFVLPTYADCLAVVLGEAMAAGLPIVTTDVAAQPEAVEDGRTGIIVPSGDADRLGQALRRLAEDAGLRHRMGRAGRARAEERFDARVNADRLADVILNGIDRWRGVRSTAPRTRAVEPMVAQESS